MPLQDLMKQDPVDETAQPDPQDDARTSDRALGESGRHHRLAYPGPSQANVPGDAFTADGVRVPIGMDLTGSRSIEDWSDAELLNQFRYVAAEFAAEEESTRAGDYGPLDVLRNEIEKRGLTVPASASAASPGRETTPP